MCQRRLCAWPHHRSFPPILGHPVNTEVADIGAGLFPTSHEKELRLGEVNDSPHPLPGTHS